MNRRTQNRFCGWYCMMAGCNNMWSFTCDKCDQVVCRSHFRYEEHQCPHHSEGDTRVRLCPCCDKAVHVKFGENANLALVEHMDSRECQRDQRECAHSAPRNARCRPQDQVGESEVRGKLVCFPFSVHKLLGNSNLKAKKRLEAMTNGMYGYNDIVTALLGTGVKLVRLDLEFPVFPESLEPGSYVFGQIMHMVGVCIREDHSVMVHDNMRTSGVGHFEPEAYYRAYKVCFEDDSITADRPTDKHTASPTLSTNNTAPTEEDDKKQQHCFPWSVCKLLGQSNMDAQKRLKEMSGGPYEVRDVRAALEGTGVTLVGLKLQNSESLPAGNYVLGRNGHVVGVCVREDGGLEVYDSQDTDGIGEFCFADYFCAWKLSSKE